MLAVEGSASEGVCGPEACELAPFKTIALLCLNGLAMRTWERHCRSLKVWPTWAPLVALTGMGF